MNQIKHREYGNSTLIVGAFVLRCDLFQFEELKKVVGELGIRIIYQRVAAPNTRLLIVEETGQPRQQESQRER